MPTNAAIEAEITKRANRFDLVPLVDLILHLGYRPEELVFESHFTSISHPGLVQKVEFRREPIRQVVVTLNFGLLDPQSPLPSYFTKLLEHGNIDDQALLKFLAFFDHAILRNFIASIYPERNRSIYKDWENTKRCYFYLLGPRSLSTLHWLFQNVFPELGVSTGHATLGRDLRVESLRLGEGRIGRTSLGALSTVPVWAAEVTLYCDDEVTDLGMPWADEVQKRLTSVIFPILRDSGVDLRLNLVVWSQRGWAQLKRGSYLGFDRIRGGEDRHRLVIIHRGPVPQR